MIGLGLGGSGAEQAATMVSLLGADAFISQLERIEKSWGAVDAAQTRASRSGAMLQKIGMGATAVTGSMIALGVAATRAGNDVVESEALVGQVFKKNTDDIKRWSEERRRSIGMNSYEQRRSAGGFKTQFDAAELGAKKATDLSKRFVEMRDDIVAFYNVKDPKEAFQALQSGVAGEAEPLRKYSIFLSDANIKAYALANGIGAANGELTEQEKIAARAGFILEAFNKSAARGAALRERNSPTGQLRRMQNERDQGLAELGVALIPIEKDLINIANQVIPVVAKGVRWFTELNENTRKWLVYLGMASGPILWIVGKLTSAAAAWKTLRQPIPTPSGLPGGIGGGSTVAVMHVKAGIVYVNGNVSGGGGRGPGGPRIPGGGPRLPGGAAGGAGGAVAGGAATRALRRAQSLKDLFWNQDVQAANKLRQLIMGGKPGARSTPSTPPRALPGPRGTGGAGGAAAQPGLGRRILDSVNGWSSRSPWFQRNFVPWVIRNQRWLGPTLNAGARGAEAAGKIVPFAKDAFKWAGKVFAPLGGYAAGRDAAGDYGRLGMDKRQANAIGIAVGTTATAMIIAAMVPAALAAAPTLALAAPAIIGGALVRYGANRLYNDPMDRVATRDGVKNAGTGLSKANSKQLLDEADKYFKERDKLMKEGDEQGALNALAQAQSYLRRAKTVQKAADEEAEKAAVQARLDQRIAEREARDVTYPGLSQNASRLAAQFGMVPSGSLLHNGRLNAVKPTVTRGSDDSTHVGFTLPPAPADRDARALRFAVMTPQPVF